MGTKYGAIGCEDAEKWGGPEGVGRNLVDIFRENSSEEWKYFPATLGELPDMSELNEYRGFILSGSHHSANSTSPWVEKLEQFIRNTREYQLKHEDSPKLFGTCFGHQIINKALGAKVVKNGIGRFVFRLDDLHVGKDLLGKSYYKEAFGDKDTFTLLQSHSEEVVDLPAEAEVLATSPVCANEIVCYGDKCLTFQGHMEVTHNQIMEIMYPSVKKAGFLTENDEKLMWKNFEEKTYNQVEVIRLIKSFFMQ